jgi:DNA-binding response OmpR family regulator
MPRDIQKGLDAGFFRYLTKPIKIDEFMQTLDTVLNDASATSAGPKTKNL